MKHLFNRVIPTFLFISLLFSAVILPACSGAGKGNSNRFPDNFNSLSDREKVDFVMKNSTPDSVARFICLAAIGKVPGVKIDTLAIATLYAYENYKDSTLAQFSSEYDTFSASLPLADKMKLYKLAGEIDPQGLGYDLGLHYVDQIREKKMNVDQVKMEIDEFRKACADDNDTYTRFLVGFKTVLAIDKGKDLSPQIYDAFINYE